MNIINSKKNMLYINLKKYHMGSEHSISGKELESVIGVDRDTIQRMVRKLRMEGVPICSSHLGYFYAETRQEIAETISRFNRHIATMMETEDRLLNSVPGNKEEVVVVIPEEGIKVSLNIKSIKKG